MKNKKSLCAIISLLSVVLIASTVAYFSRDLIMENRLNTAKYDTVIDEEFIPTDKWTPGVEIAKKVTVKNIGNVDIVVRVKMTELWQRSEDIIDPNNPDNILSYKGSVLTNTFVTEDGVYHDAVIKNFVKDMVYNYEDIKDNLEVYKNKWIHYGNYYYYLGTVTSNMSSNGLLESVTMNPLLDVVINGSHTVVQADELGQKKVTKNYTYGKYGYDSADYTLRIEAKTVQASKEAILDAFGNDVLAIFVANNFATIR